MKEAKKNNMVFPSDFKIRGGLVLSGSISPTVARCIKALDALPFKELITPRQLAALAKATHYTLMSLGADPALAPYKFQHQHKNYWGNKKTIAELKRQMES